MQKTLFEEFIKYRAVILCWPFGDSFPNIIDTQKSFARLVMSLSVAAPVFIYVTNEEYDKAYYLLPKHINFIKVDDDFVFLGREFLITANDLVKPAIGVNNLYLTHSKKAGIVNIFNRVLLDFVKVEGDFKSSSFFIPSNGFSYNGLDTLIVSKASLATYNISLNDLENLPGITKLMVLEQNSIEPIAKFINQDTIILHQETQDGLNYQEYKDIVSYVLRIAKLEHFEVISIPASGKFNATKNQLFSYTSIIQLNEIVIVPLLDPSLDNEILQLYTSIFKEQSVIGVEALDLLIGGGSLRDYSLRVPKL